MRELTAATSPQPRLTRCRVVIADDDPAVRQAYVAKLASDGRFDIVGACAEATELPALVAGTRPHLVILDEHMGETSGLEVLVLVRRETPNALVGIMTDQPKRASRTRAAAAGAVAYFAKPPVDDLVSVLLTKCERRHGERRGDVDRRGGTRRQQLVDRRGAGRGQDRRVLARRHGERRMGERRQGGFLLPTLECADAGTSLPASGC